MKDAIKLVIRHFFIITICVTAVIGVGNMISPDFSGYPREFPLHLLFVGATSALPSFLFHFKKEPTRKQFIRRIFLHFCCIMAIVLGEGWLLGWYENAVDTAVVAGCVVLVYLAVWIITSHSDAKTEQSINEALKNYNNEEEE